VWGLFYPNVEQREPKSTRLRVRTPKRAATSRRLGARGVLPGRSALERDLDITDPRPQASFIELVVRDPVPLVTDQHHGRVSCGLEAWQRPAPSANASALFVVDGVDAESAAGRRTVAIDKSAINVISL
jgi:hypothetical protein